jgi:hypothetical protein
MSIPMGSEEEPRRLKRKDYVTIIGTNDEWEDLIGVVDDILDSDGNSCQRNKIGTSCLVRIPLSRSNQAPLRLVGVNFITPYVRHELRQNEDVCLFMMKHLEWVDPDDL